MPPLTSVKPKFHLSPFVLTPWIISSNPAVSTTPFIQVSSMSPLQPRPRPWAKGLPPNCLVNPWKVGSPEPSSLSPLPHTPPHGGWTSRQGRTFHSLTLHIYPLSIPPSNILPLSIFTTTPQLRFCHPLPGHLQLLLVDLTSFYFPLLCDLHTVSKLYFITRDF